MHRPKLEHHHRLRITLTLGVLTSMFLAWHPEYTATAQLVNLLTTLVWIWE